MAIEKLLYFKLACILRDERPFTKAYARSSSRIEQVTLDEQLKRQN